jgi:hypothetical protein
VILALTLTILSTCSTTPPVEAPKAVDPALDFPLFPDPFRPDGTPIPAFDLGAQTVMVPLAYWLKITEYVVDVEKVRETYEAWQEVYLAPGEP